MIKKDFLFEIGVEEIPAGYIESAIRKLQTFFETTLKEAKLSFDSVKIYSTPRRFAIRLDGLPIQQQDEIIERVGPAKNMAYDENGNLSKAALGFLRGAKATETDIFIKETPKSDKIAVKIEIKGKETKIILINAMKEVITKIVFPKSMKWGNYSTNFARPIRWFVALFGDEILNFKFDAVKSGNITFGNRYQKLENPVEISTINDYENALKSVCVYADRAKRKTIIEQQLVELFADSDEKIIEDKKLLEIVVDLVESPTVVIAEFSQKYLELPEKIITSTLSQHQKYFAVRKDGKLTNKFVFISNGNPKFSDLIKLGNEKVIKARLEDATFFFKEDTKQPLENFVEKLSEVTFQAKLGSLLEKTERIIKIAKYIAEKLMLSEDDKLNILRASKLAKADLVTLMLGEKEFTKLQGYIGMNYALLSGENEAVATAIYEHYQPRGQNDNLPNSLISSIVAIADKMDTVCGIIGVGLVPSGSNDPFALRRAANGIVQIIDAQNMNLNLLELIDFTFEKLADKIEIKNQKIVNDFFKQRVNWLLKQANLDYDIIESVMHINFANISDLKKRALDLQKFKQRDDFKALVTGFKRVSNIIAKADELGEIDEILLIETAEKNLYGKFIKLDLEKYLSVKDYEKAMEILVDFRVQIDTFFDEVMVNADDEKIKANRYNLLGKNREMFLQIADIAKIVVN